MKSDPIFLHKMSKSDLSLTPTRRSKRRLVLEDEKSESPEKILVKFVGVVDCGLIEVIVTKLNLPTFSVCNI